MILTASLLLLSLPAPPPLSGGEVVLLKDKPSRKFSYVLPGERWLTVGDDLPIVHQGGTGFAVQTDGEALLVDTDGDGIPERRIEGGLNEDTGERKAFCLLEGTRTPGADLRYGVRLRNQGKGWEWAPSGAVQGKLGGQKIAVIDQDGDGIFGEIGQDALIVGSGKRATFLSATMHVDGKLMALRVNSEGTQLELEPYQGAIGTLDLATDFEADGRVLGAVIKSSDGKHSFDLARSSGPLSVPSGRYRLHSGLLGLGEARVEVLEGNMKPMQVQTGQATSLAWGGPSRAEFTYQRSGNDLQFDPNEVWWYGAAGEEYKGWAPRGKSPEFTVVERKLGTELLKALFPGSC